MATRGSYMYVHNSMVKVLGYPKKVRTAVFSNFWWFQTKLFTGLLQLIKLYKQNPLEEIFISTIYPNYTLALRTANMSAVLLLHVYLVSFSIVWFPIENESKFY